MDLNLSKAGGKNENLSTLCTDIFLIVIKMRDAENLGETAALRKLILYYLNQFEKNCSVIKISPEVVNAVKYALVALMDETVLSIPGEARDFWIVNPLQLEIYGDNIAGQEFFNKLDLLIKDPAKNRDALEVYYLCLTLGFEGKYKIGNAGERENIITNLASTLSKFNKSSIDSLSPHALRLTIKNRQGVTKTGFIPLWVLASSLAALLVAAWFVMRTIALNSSDAVVKMIGG